MGVEWNYLVYIAILGSVLGIMPCSATIIFKQIFINVQQINIFDLLNLTDPWGYWKERYESSFHLSSLFSVFSIDNIKARCQNTKFQSIKSQNNRIWKKKIHWAGRLSCRQNVILHRIGSIDSGSKLELYMGFYEFRKF